MGEYSIAYDETLVNPKTKKKASTATTQAKTLEDPATTSTNTNTSAGEKKTIEDVLLRLEALSSAYTDIQDRLYELDKSWKNNLMIYGVPCCDGEEDDPIITEEKVSIFQTLNSSLKMNYFSTGEGNSNEETPHFTRHSNEPRAPPQLRTRLPRPQTHPSVLGQLS